MLCVRASLQQFSLDPRDLCTAVSEYAGAVVHLGEHDPTVISVYVRPLVAWDLDTIR